jgi:integrase
MTWLSLGQRKHTERTKVHFQKEECNNNNEIAIYEEAKNPQKCPQSRGYLLPELKPFSSDSRGFESLPARHLLPDGNLARREGVAEGFYWDRELPGFGLRVYRSGRKRWIVQLRQRKATRRITLGDPEGMSAPDARRAARAILAQNALDGLPTRQPRAERHDPRFSAYVAEFWKDCSAHWKGSTQARNRQAIDGSLVPYFGRRHIGMITRPDILAWKDALRDRQGKFNRELPVLAAMLGYAEKLGYRPKGSNPCRGMPRYKRQLPERYLTAKEFRRLGAVLAECEPVHSEAVAVIRLLMFTGARCSEITGLQWEWIDPPYAQLPDSKTGPKRLYLNRQAIELLDAWKGEGVGAVFPNASSRRNLLPKAWETMRRKAAIPDVRLHDLRHSFASVGIMDGISLARVGKLLGHALPETTARYAHLADSAIADAAARVSGSIAADLGLRS